MPTDNICFQPGVAISEGRETFLERSRVDTSCTQQYYINLYTFRWGRSVIGVTIMGRQKWLKTIALYQSNKRAMLLLMTGCFMV